MVSRNRAGAGSYAFPQQSAPMAAGNRKIHDEWWQNESGIASLTHGGRTFRFRTNPNEFSWSYQLIKRVDQTYGGRVIQLLGTNIGDFSFKVETGGGRWPYMVEMTEFLKNIMIRQRNGIPATFEYTTRGWKLRCFITSFPFQDQVDLASQELQIQTKVQEDVSGMMSKISLSAELMRLKDGIGWERSKYNDPVLQSTESTGSNVVRTGIESVNALLSGVNDVAGIQGYANNNFLPGPSAGAPQSSQSHVESQVKPPPPR